MSAAFDVTPSTRSLRLDQRHRGSVTFTVRNASGRTQRARAAVTGAGDGQLGWYTIAGSAEFDFPVDGSHAFVVDLAAPPDQPPATTRFRLAVIGQVDPDENQGASDEVTVVIPPPPRRALPWLPIGAAGGTVMALLAIGVTVLATVRSIMPGPLPVAQPVPGVFDAVVSGDGKLVRGTPGIVVVPNAGGPDRFVVLRFPNGDVSECALTVTVGSVGLGTVAGPGQAYTAGGFPSINEVTIATTNLGGGFVHLPFHLSVDCSKQRLWAIVGPKGQLFGVIRAGVQKVTYLGPGRYSVEFDRDVRSCVSTAGNSSLFAAGSILATRSDIATAPDPGDSHSVSVLLTGGDAKFDLEVACSTGTSQTAFVGAGAPRGDGHPVVLSHQDGEYDIGFDHDVSRCAFVATVSAGFNASGTQLGIITTGTGRTDSAAVHVETIPLGGLAPHDLPFDLVVSC
jgi:hypothetical protein